MRKLQKVLLLCAALCLTALAGCGQNTATAAPSQNEILAYRALDLNKPTIVLVRRMVADTATYLNPLKEQFPQYNFVMRDIGTGINSDLNLVMQLEHNCDIDIVLSNEYFNTIPQTYYENISGYAFTGRYYDASLKSLIGEDNSLYVLPGPSAAYGMVYNTEMFAENGWQVPSNQAEFIALCKEIAPTGIRPCLSHSKYAVNVVNNFMGSSYTKIFTDLDAYTWYDEFMAGNASAVGHMEPFFETAKAYIDNGIILPEDFTKSMGANGDDFNNGLIAMLSAKATINDYENGRGFLPCLAEDGQDSYIGAFPTYFLSVPKKAIEDEGRKDIIFEVVDYMSTPEYQNAIMGENSLLFSNIRDANRSNTNAYPVLDEIIREGRYFTQLFFESNDYGKALPNKLRELVIAMMEDGMTVEDAVKAFDEENQRLHTMQREETQQPVVIGTLDKDVSELEVAQYAAQKLKDATGAQIGVSRTGSIRGILANFFAGDITDQQAARLYLKNSNKDDCLSVYEMTGAHIKEMLGRMPSATYTAAGLKVELAPWAAKGEKLVSATFADGTALVDDETYTVAAWTNVIDEDLVDGAVSSQSEQTDFVAFMTAAIKKDGTILTFDDGRLTLNWDIIEDKAE